MSETEKVSEELRLYIQQMEAWFKEQEILDNQIQRAIKDHSNIANLNKQQLELHRKRINITRLEFDNWKADNDIT